MKSKGLQKVKYYCQMCEKQCRDANGFKCHCESEGHIRMMELYAAQPEKYQRDFSNLFQDGFVKLLRLHYKSKQVNANVIYNMYIQDKHHIHMNSTQWTTLSSFVHYLESKHIIEVEKSNSGFLIKLIPTDEDLELEMKMKEKQNEIKEEREDMKEIFDKMIEQQKRRGREEMNVEETIVDTKKPKIVMNKPIQKIEKKKKSKVVFDDENEKEEKQQSLKRKKMPITK